MKQIIAIVKPFLVEKILDALRRAPLEALSVAEVKGMGKQKSYLDRYADTEYALTFLPKVEITVWVDDLRADEVARKIVEVARTGRIHHQRGNVDAHPRQGSQQPSRLREGHGRRPCDHDETGARAIGQKRPEPGDALRDLEQRGPQIADAGDRLVLQENCHQRLDPVLRELRHFKQSDGMSGRCRIHDDHLR